MHHFQGGQRKSLACLQCDSEKGESKVSRTAQP